MTTIRFTVPAVPVAQPRVKACIRGKHAGVYTPGKHAVHAFKATVRMAAAEAYKGSPLGGPIAFAVTFYMPRPQRRKDAWHITKPDLDNLEKACLDALNGLCWLDDKQVCMKVSSKLYSPSGEAPHVNVSVVEMPA